jgi:hypothetical protein
MTSLRHTAILADNQTVSLHRSNILPTLFAILPDNQAVGQHSTKTIVMKNKLRIKKMDQARERASGRQPVGWARKEDGSFIWFLADEKINSARSLNPEE